MVWIRRRPGLTFCAWQLCTSMLVAAVFFGTIRLRTPYDPYAIVLALEGWVLVFALLAGLWGRLRARSGSGAESEPQPEPGSELEPGSGSAQE